MPLCTSLQYPLQNRAKIQKKIEICKKNNKIPDFSRVVLSLDFLSAKAILWEMSISVCRVFLRASLSAAMLRGWISLKHNADEYLTHPRYVSIRLL